MMVDSQRPRKAKGKGIKQRKDHPAETARLRPDAQVDVNGAGAHPVWRFLISNQPRHHGYPGATGTAVQTNIPDCWDELGVTIPALLDAFF